MGRSTSQETLLSDKRKYRKFTAQQKDVCARIRSGEVLAV